MSLDLADIGDTTTETEVRRDQWGRYKVVPPEGGKPKGYTRATTVAKALDETSNLMAWKQRMTALGLVARPDILATIATLDPEDRNGLNKHCERAAEAGGATARRDLGTAIHKLVERKIADPSWKVPELYARDVEAIITAVDRAGYDIVTEYSEVVIVLDRLMIAGTADLILRRRSDGMLVIADLKTGSSVTYGALAFSIQLAVYATGDCIYVQGAAPDGSQDERRPMPAIDRTTALILHCEPGSGTCSIYNLDIARGAEALEVAMAVREWRTAGKSKKDPLLVPLTTVEASEDSVTHVAFEDGESSNSSDDAEVGPAPETTEPPTSSNDADAEDSTPSASASTGSGDTATGDGAGGPSAVGTSPEPSTTRLEWILRRIELIRAAGHTRSIGLAWPKDGTLPKPGDVRKGSAEWTSDQLLEVDKILAAVEAKFEMPFDEPDPEFTSPRHETIAERKEAREVALAEADARPAPLVASTHDGTDVDQDDIDNIRGVLAELDPALKAHVIGWSKQAQEAGTAWNIGKSRQRRRYAISAAAIALTEHVDLTEDDPDELVRAALRFITDGPVDGHPVGAVLGTLDVDQAMRLGDVLNTAVVTFDDAGTPQLTAAA